MFIRMLLSAAILNSAVLGHLCMMPMAFAMEAIPMDHDMQETEHGTEMVMTPLEPPMSTVQSLMSPLHCEHCIQVTQKKSGPMTDSCAGHCLSKVDDFKSAISASPLVLAALTPPTTIVATPEAGQRFAASTAPPGNAPPTRTIVMLQ